MKGTKLSVNINKIATLRNSRGGTNPSVVEAAIKAQRFGADGITVHPRPDERHIRYQDVYDLKPVVHTEFNIEGYPNGKFMQLVLDVKPTQVTLVPDPPGALTSNAGWDTIKNRSFLQDIIAQLTDAGIRSSIFIETDAQMIRAAKETGTDRIELYTESYAVGYPSDPKSAIAPFVEAAQVANEVGLGINAGHDLSLENLAYFAANIPNLLEVSIGHALISDAIYYGLSNTVKMYKNCLSVTSPNLSFPEGEPPRQTEVGNAHQLSPRKGGVAEGRGGQFSK
ncbi:MAG: pyridoxine 5'-phosphate synthase [Flavobacteriales bacterium]|nr:pyridoxine 5'-phosphate synthase [Flavobacteriales bacterium]